MSKRVKPTKIDRYTKRPVHVTAAKFTGENENLMALAKWMGAALAKATNTELVIQMIDGQVKAEPGDMIVLYQDGQFCACKPDQFKETYKRAA